MASRYDEAWRRVRLELVLCAEGGTTNFDRHVNAGKPGAKAPPKAGEDLSRFDYRWLCAGSDGARRRIIDDALRHLKQMRTPNVDPELLKQRDSRDPDRSGRDFKLTVAAEQRSARTVASMYGVSVRTVYNWREKYGKRGPVLPPRAVQSSSG